MIFFLATVPGILVIIFFIRYLFTGINFFEKASFGILEVFSVGIVPLLFIFIFDLSEKNDCCSESAVFSPSHRISVYFLILLCIASYFYCSIRSTIGAPILEVIANCFLIIGIILNVFIAVQTEAWFFYLFGNVPLIMLFVLMLIRNHWLFIDNYVDDRNGKNRLEKIAWKILQLRLFQKLPVFLILCLPLIVFIIIVFLLFGQKPDSFIRAFTDTYKHGFSQLDYECDQVVCEGHYLCTIAAKGHTNLVKPVRAGVRGGKKIICNRQLLISNAFEELLEDHVPLIHRPIRKIYDVIGSYIERYYFVFNNKFVSDFVYVLMKPLEWFFLIILYVFDKKPENRIATQYLSKEDRQLIKKVTDWTEA